ncbi:MAG TPA: hypothetical protein VIM65_07775 [Cyclobacteriaceae bacterium]
MEELKKPFRDTKVGTFLKDKFPQILNTVGDVLPTNGVFGVVKNLIKQVPDISPTEQAEAIAKIEAFEKDFAEMEAQDRMNARAMQIEALRQDDQFSKRFIYYFAMLIISAAIVFGVMLFFVPIPEANKRLVEMFCDLFLFAAALTIINYFYGASKLSHDKYASLLNNKA